MCDNEYLAHQMVRDRLREAEARGAFNAMIQEALAHDAGRAPARPSWLELWWQARAAWLAHLALPKVWNRP